MHDFRTDLITALKLANYPSHLSKSPTIMLNNTIAPFALSADISASLSHPLVQGTALFFNSKASVSAEGVVSLNQKISFAGDRSNLQDDALLYAGRGVNFNQSPDFSLKLDGNGTPIRNAAGLLELRQDALTIGTNYTTFNTPNNPYADTLQTVGPRTIEVPQFTEVITTTLSQKVPTGSTFGVVNIGQLPMNSAADWSRVFPGSGSSNAPMLIRVAGGGLNIPDGATLKNAVVIVESGDINFNGKAHGLENVVFIAEQGSVNLGSIQAKDLTVFASQSIHMNREARFSGQTLIANGGKGDIIFNGAMESNGPSDSLKVISQGQLIFNASSDTRGELFSRGDFSFNSSVELLGTIATKGNLTFNGAGSVRSLSLNPTPAPIPDPIPINLNRSPEIITTPNLQSLVGDIYRYNVDATDPDGDALTYRLSSSPLNMTIDSLTGQINWNTATTQPGTYQTEVQVIDNRGGLTKQGFNITLNAQPVVQPNDKTGDIRGVVWNDINRNGVIDSNLVQGQNPDIVFVIDISGSAIFTFQGTAVGDLNNDLFPNTVLDAEIAGFQELSRLLAKQGLGDRSRVSLIAFDDYAGPIDMNPQLPGIQSFTSLTADADNNGISDVEDALFSLRIGGGTNFEAPLQQVESIFKTLKTTPGNGNMIFLSDGDGYGSFGDEVDRLNKSGVNLSAFGVGAGASLNTLKLIDPKAKIFNSVDELLNLFGGVQSGSQSALESGIANVKVYVDLNGNGRLDINEPTQLTNAAGEYRFTGIKAGTYEVRQDLPVNYQRVFPTGAGSYQVTLVGDDVILDRNFGNVLTSV